jgi:uncharacterized protein (DUF608 family)
MALLLLSSMTSLHAQEKSLSERVHFLKHYDADQLLRIALPLGGIGTGTVSLGGRGELRDWEIMNVPAKGYSTVTDGNDAPFFAIYAKPENGPAHTKALLGPVHDAEYQHYEGRSVNHHGLPRFRESSFDASYPFGQVSLADSTFPARVKIIGYNPLIPGEAEDSGIPLAILQYEVENISGENMEVSISGSLRNFIGKDGRESTTDWKGDIIPQGAKGNYNTFRRTEDLAGIFMESEGVDSLHRAWGTIALSAPGDEGEITYRTSSEANAWGRAILDFWDDFSADGRLTEKDRQWDEDPMASLAVRKTLAPGERKTFTFYLTWHFPNRQSWGSWSEVPETWIGNYYTTQYDDAWDVIQKEHPRLPGLTDKTLSFVNTLVNSSYSEAIKEAALFNLSTLRSQTVFRTPDGRMFGWEGVFDRFGSCFGSCTHVWNYEQATGFLFNELATTMREVEFAYATDEQGLMSFRTNLPLEKATAYGKAAADGQMGAILKFYREWQLSGDNDFLEKHWPKVKAALAFAWIPGGWDGDVDGVMEGVQHNTMDVEYFGPNPQMQIWYLGALRAAAEMAAAMEEKAFAEKCRRLFAAGSSWTDEHLFNGEYYFHKVQPPASKEDIAPGLSAGMGSKDLKNPDYQLATGCLIDQLVGQYMAHTLGLGYLVDQEHVRTALESIYQYNKREDMFDHFNNMRSYAMGDEKAWLMASYPRGGRPEVPFPYWSEVMTGFEYTAAIGMLYEGMEEKALDMISGIRTRYNGARRNPFDEAECGHHYARAMASWAGVLAQSGFHYSGVDKSIRFTSRPGRYFWSNGTAWGEFILSKKPEGLAVEFSVLHGEVELNSFELDGNGKEVFKQARSVKEGEQLQLVF